MKEKEALLHPTKKKNHPPQKQQKKPTPFAMSKKNAMKNFSPSKEIIRNQKLI